MEKAEIKIRRYDPALGRETWQHFRVSTWKDRSLLDVLNEIQVTQDPSLAVRCLCNQGCCGGCAVLLNRQPVLACQEPAQAVMEVEPHPGFQVIRDLVIDYSKPIGEGETDLEPHRTRS